MIEITRKSRFKLNISFLDMSGSGLSLNFFGFKYKTPLSQPYVVSYIGDNYVNCAPLEHGVAATFDVPDFNVGRLEVLRKYIIVDNAGVETPVTQLDYLDFMIVEGFAKS